MSGTIAIVCVSAAGVIVTFSGLVYTVKTRRKTEVDNRRLVAQKVIGKIDDFELSVTNYSDEPISNVIVMAHGSPISPEGITIPSKETRKWDLPDNRSIHTQDSIEICFHDIRGNAWSRIGNNEPRRIPSG